MEGKKFQIRTDKKIDNNNHIRWYLNGPGWFTFNAITFNAAQCNQGKSVHGTEGFLQQPGTLTFLKSTTQLQVWFDDVLEVTWVYEDNAGGSCAMKRQMKGMKFKSPAPKYDKVSTHYRYKLGNFTPTKYKSSLFIIVDLM